MRKILFAAAAAAALLLTGAAPAFASNGPPPNANSADNVHFTADYLEGTLSAGVVRWQCTGEHIVNNAQTKDSETCALSGPGLASYVPGRYGDGPLTGNPALGGTFPGFPGFTGFFWFSDSGSGQTTSNFLVTVNGAGTRAHVEAIYG
jgi:hypothetical protein